MTLPARRRPASCLPRTSASVVSGWHSDRGITWLLFTVCYSGPHPGPTGTVQCVMLSCRLAPKSLSLRRVSGPCAPGSSSSSLDAAALVSSHLVAGRACRATALLPEIPGAGGGLRGICPYQHRLLSTNVTEWN